VTSIDNGDAGGVVASVFEPAQTVQQNGHGLSPPNVSDNPAHLGRNLPSATVNRKIHESPYIVLAAA
jgi:hypothetical protein